MSVRTWITGFPSSHGTSIATSWLYIFPLLSFDSRNQNGDEECSKYTQAVVASCCSFQRSPSG